MTTYIKSKNIKVYPTPNRGKNITTKEFYDPESKYNTEAQISNLLKSYSKKFVLSHSDDGWWEIILAGHYFKFLCTVSTSSNNNLYACVKLGNNLGVSENNTTIEGKYLQYVNSSKEVTETEEKNSNICLDEDDTFYGLALETSEPNTTSEYTDWLEIWDGIKKEVPTESLCKLKGQEIWLSNKEKNLKDVVDNIDDKINSGSYFTKLDNEDSGLQIKIGETEKKITKINADRIETFYSDETSTAFQKNILNIQGSSDSYKLDVTCVKGDDLEVRQTIRDDVSTKFSWYGNNTDLMVLRPVGSGVTITGAELDLNGDMSADNLHLSNNLIIQGQAKDKGGQFNLIDTADLSDAFKYKTFKLSSEGEDSSEGGHIAALNAYEKKTFTISTIESKGEWLKNKKIIAINTYSDNKLVCNAAYDETTSSIHGSLIALNEALPEYSVTLYITYLSDTYTNKINTDEIKINFSWQDDDNKNIYISIDNQNDYAVYLSIRENLSDSYGESYEADAKGESKRYCYALKNNNYSINSIKLYYRLQAKGYSDDFNSSIVSTPEIKNITIDQNNSYLKMDSSEKLYEREIYLKATNENKIPVISQITCGNKSVTTSFNPNESKYIFNPYRDELVSTNASYNITTTAVNRSKNTQSGNLTVQLASLNKPSFTSKWSIRESSWSDTSGDIHHRYRNYVSIKNSHGFNVYYNVYIIKNDKVLIEKDGIIESYANKNVINESGEGEDKNWKGCTVKAQFTNTSPKGFRKPSEIAEATME